MRRFLVMVVGALALGLALSGPAEANPGGVVVESFRTAGHAVRDSALTLGRTVRDFFVTGPRAAGRTWEANAAHVRDQARRDARRVRREANG
jgi:hypothetical protein